MRPLFTEWSVAGPLDYALAVRNVNIAVFDVIAECKTFTDCGQMLTCMHFHNVLLQLLRNAS